MERRAGATQEEYTLEERNTLLNGANKDPQIKHRHRKATIRGTRKAEGEAVLGRKRGEQVERHNEQCGMAERLRTDALIGDDEGRNDYCSAGSSGFEQATLGGYEWNDAAA